MFNEVLKSGASNILPLNEIERKREQTSLPQVGTAAHVGEHHPMVLKEGGSHAGPKGFFKLRKKLGLL